MGSLGVSPYFLVLCNPAGGGASVPCKPVYCTSTHTQPEIMHSLCLTVHLMHRAQIELHCPSVNIFMHHATSRLQHTTLEMYVYSLVLAKYAAATSSPDPIPYIKASLAHGVFRTSKLHFHFFCKMDHITNYSELHECKSNLDPQNVHRY